MAASLSYHFFLILGIHSIVMGTFDFDANFSDIPIDYSPLNNPSSSGPPSNMLGKTAGINSLKPPETYEIWPHTQVKKLSFNHCYPSLWPRDKMAFKVLRSEDGTRYRAHIVKKEEQRCFKDKLAHEENCSLKRCLEKAALLDAPSFHFNQKNNTCQLYKNWRQVKFTNCRRGSFEEMFYLKESEPSGFKPCKGVTMTFDTLYTADGNVQIVGYTVNDYCCCDIDRITLQYMEYEGEMTLIPEIPTYTYVYPLSHGDAWNNDTTMSIYAKGSLLKQIDYVPSAEM